MKCKHVTLNSRPPTCQFSVPPAVLKVLIVDDYEIGSDALSAYLGLENMECRTAVSGYAALEMDATWLPHIILMDISMPELGGVETAQAVRGTPNGKCVIIIAFTALNWTDVERIANGGEFDGYWQKGQPIDLLTQFVLRSVT